MKFLQDLSNWSEVWGLLIPLASILIYRPKEKYSRLLTGYVFLAFLLNGAATLMLVYPYLMPDWVRINRMVNNNILYNIHSVVRVLLFSSYIISVRPYRSPLLLKSLLVIYGVLVLLNFSFHESPFFLSTRLFAAESIVLLIISLSYFIRSIQDESTTNWLKHPSFLVCAGISLYEVITFFIFLFFYPLSEKDPSFFLVTMRIYTSTYVLFCILLALALYQSAKQMNQPAKPY